MGVIRFLAVLQWVHAGVLLFQASPALVAPGTLPPTLDQGIFVFVRVLARAGVPFSFVWPGAEMLLLAAVILSILGIGLWRRWHWSRVALVGLCCAALLMCVALVAPGNMLSHLGLLPNLLIALDFDPAAAGAFSVAWLLLFGVEIWLVQFWRPVKAQFH